MLKLAGEYIEGQLADHTSCLDAHVRSELQVAVPGQYRANWPGSLTIENVVAGNIMAAPLIVARKISLDRLAIEVTTAGAAGTGARLGVYGDNGAGYPAGLVADLGTVPVDSTGVKALVIDLLLEKGLYWCVILSDGAPNVRGLVPLMAPTGLPAGGGGAVQAGYLKPQAYGALPVSFPGGAGFSNWDCALYMLRLAALL